MDRLYGALSGMSGGAPKNPEMIVGLKAAANARGKPGIGAFLSDKKQNGAESKLIHNLSGGFSGSERSDYSSEKETTSWSGMTRDVNFRRRLLEKIKNGVKDCCPN